MEQLITAIRRLDGLDTVKQLLLQLPRESLEHQDESFDVLHHAIEVDYPEVVLFSFLRGLFLEPHQPRKVPYLHLACWLGRISVVHILLEHRPGDFHLKISPKVLSCIRVQWSEGLEESESQHIKTSAADDNLHIVDVAATAGHLKCVQALLASTALKCNRVGALEERAVEANSPAALQLLLQNTKNRNIYNINKAFREAVRRKLHQCVQVLLKHGAQPKAALNNLNPYHVLYMYSSAYQVFGQENRNKGLDDTTQVLLLHGSPTDVREPFGSFPLYSLIHSLVQEKDYHPASVPTYHINTLRLLLNHGADPNFDELKYAKERDKRYYYNSAVGRDLFTSGLNAFFVSLQASDTWRLHVTQYLEECVKLLLHHGADPGYMDCHGQSPLHDLMKVIAMQHAMGHTHCNVRKMCRMLLSYGSDPNLQSETGLFPVSQYFNLLCELMGGLIAFERWKTADNAEQVIHMLHYMEHEKALKAYSQVVECMTRAKDDGMTDIVIEFFSKQMSDVINTPKPLQDLCKLYVWRSVGRKKNNLDHLPIPKSLVRAVHGMFE